MKAKEDLASFLNVKLELLELNAIFSTRVIYTKVIVYIYIKYYRSSHANTTPPTRVFLFNR